MTEKRNISFIEKYEEHVQGQPITLFKDVVREEKITDAGMIDFDCSFEEGMLNRSSKSLVSSNNSDGGFLWVIPILHAVPTLIVTACM